MLRDRFHEYEIMFRHEVSPIPITAAMLGRASTSETRESEEPDSPIPAAPPERDWVEFLIQDDETGEPIGGVTLKVKLPNGEIRDFTTGGDGKIAIPDIDPGSCEITKMIDEYALEVLEVR